MGIEPISKATRPYQWRERASDCKVKPRRLPGCYGIVRELVSREVLRPPVTLSAGVDKIGGVGVVAGGCWYGYRCQVVVQSQSESQEISGNVQFIINVIYKANRDLFHIQSSLNKCPWWYQKAHTY